MNKWSEYLAKNVILESTEANIWIETVQCMTLKCMTKFSITSISASADGPYDAALRKIDSIMHTEYNYRAVSIGR